MFRFACLRCALDHFSLRVIEHGEIVPARWAVEYNAYGLPLTIKVLPECEAHPQKWLYGIYLPNRYLSSKVRLFLDAVENGLTA